MSIFFWGNDKTEKRSEIKPPLRDCLWIISLKWQKLQKKSNLNDEFCQICSLGNSKTDWLHKFFFFLISLEVFLVRILDLILSRHAYITKGQLNSEWVYEDIDFPKYQQKYLPWKISGSSKEAFRAEILKIFPSLFWKSDVRPLKFILSITLL